MVSYTGWFQNKDGRQLFFTSYGSSRATSLVSGKLTLAANDAGQLDFEVAPGNSLHGVLSKDTMRETRITLYREMDGLQECLFCGFTASVSVNSDNVLSVQCNGLLSVLNDMIVPPFSFPQAGQNATPADYFRAIIDMANAAAFHEGELYGAYILRGNISPPDYGRACVREYEKPTSAMELLSHLIDTVGGYLLPEYSEASVTLNYYAGATSASQQNIEAGINLVDLETEFDSDDYYSGIYATGAEVDGVELTLPWTDTAQAYSGGYLFRGGFYRSAQDVEKLSKTAYVRYDDCTTQAGLLQAVKRDLESHASAKRLTKVTAADLGYITSVPVFRLLQSVRINSPAHKEYHEIAEPYLITRLNIDLCNPENCEVMVDTQLPTLTSMTSSGSGSASVPSTFFRPGDTVPRTVFYTAGFVTSSSRSVRFVIPLSKPCAATGVTVGLDMYLRQNGKYTHGSSENTTVKPSSISASLTPLGVVVEATMSSTTNAVNNAPIGVAAFVTLNFT